MSVSYPILQPAIALVLWSLLVLLWMSAVRIPALRRANLDQLRLPRPAQGESLVSRFIGVTTVRLQEL